MSKYDLVLTNNIDCDEIYNYISKVLTSDRTLFLTATQNLKRIRTKHIKFEKPNVIYTFSELNEKVYDEIRKGPRFLSRADQKFILNQTIKSLFTGERQQALYKIRNDLFELYEFMIGEEISDISDEVLEKIAKDFTATEKDIFTIYNKYYNTLFNLKQGIIPPELQLDNLQQGKTIKLLCEVYNHNLFNQVDDYDTIILDGFLFFNEEQKKLLLDAKIKNKNIIFIAKQMEADRDSFLLNELFLPLQDELHIEFAIKILNPNEEIKENAITFVKNNYLDFDIETTIPMEKNFKFYEPFPSRDRELNYVVSCVSRYLKSKCGDNKEAIAKTLAEDMAIVIANDKEKYQHQLNVILKDVGVFFLNHESDFINQLDSKNLKEVIYNRAEFIETTVKRVNGKPLNRQEKIVAFKKLYKGINISQKARSFINYPIGQYILEIYRIINEGMSCEGFKKILYSNWYYNVGLDTIKYDRFIKEFHYIEPYLQRKKTLTEWIDELKKLKIDKEQLNKAMEYRFHPLLDISNDTLEFLINQVTDTKIMVDNLSAVSGTINMHLKALNDNFLLDEILTNENLANEFEIEIIKHLKEIIDNINKSNLITNIDSKYFSDNIRNMLTDYEREKAESSADELTLNVVNLENMQKFDLTFFCMMEEDKYPRQYRVNFPFSENIVEILGNPKYEIEHRPSFVKTLDYHIRLEKFLFLNVLDFTKHQMIITQTEEENGKQLRNSIYIEDIFSMFKQDIKYTKLKEAQTRIDENYNPIKNVVMDYNDNKPIKLSELVSYFLCPKLYYYITNSKLEDEISYDSEWKLNIYIPSLIYYKTLYKLELNGKKTNKVYTLNNNEFVNDVEKLLEETLKEELEYFDFLSEYDIKDIRNRTEININSFIERNIYGKDLLFFQFDLTDKEVIKIVNEMGKVVDIVLDGCLKLKNAENGYSMSYDISSTMDFLVRGAGGDTYQLQHFQEIFDKLAERNPYDDRMALIYFMFFKLNVQLLNPKYRRDGLQRLKELTRYIIKQRDDNCIPSSYCRYCKFESICKSKERGAV